MKLAFGIFLHSVRLVFGNLGVALRISALLYMAMYAGSFALALWLLPRDQDAAIQLLWMLFMLLLMVPFFWIVVAWHRFVLLDEAPQGLLAPFHGQRMFHYALKSLLIGVIVFVTLFIPIALLSALAASARSAATSPVLMFVPLLALVAIFVISQRLGVILPAAAIGKPLRIGEAWAATRGKLGTIVLLTIIWAVCSFGLNLPKQLFQTGPLVLPFQFGWGLITGWLDLMVGVSILTTLYGVFVEGRPVDGQASAPLQKA